MISSFKNLNNLRFCQMEMDLSFLFKNQRVPRVETAKRLVVVVSIDRITKWFKFDYHRNYTSYTSYLKNCLKNSKSGNNVGLHCVLRHHVTMKPTNTLDF